MGPSEKSRGSAVFIWTDRALFVGDRSETTDHSHHAIELCIALDELGIQMISGAIKHDRAPGVMVRAEAGHRLTIPGEKVAVLYIDPQAGIASALHGWLGDRSIAKLPESLVLKHRDALLALLRDGTTGLPEASAVCTALVRALCPTAPERGTRLDARLERALAIIDVRLDDPPSLDELSGQLGMSSSRLRHAFKAQVGLPITRYVLWMRLRSALTTALQGATMTEAAHEAGFADAAHFTRTCRKMFGLPPTAFAPVDALFDGTDGTDATDSFKPTDDRAVIDDA